MARRPFADLEWERLDNHHRRGNTTMKPNQLIIKLGCGCLWCDTLIPMKKAKQGKMICSIKCLKEMKSKFKNDYDKNDVWIKG